MIVTEIIHETKQRTLIKARRNSKKIIITACVVAVLLTALFYSFGIPQKDPLYSKYPIIASMPLILMSSFNAVGISSIMLFFFWALGESTHSQVKHSLEERHNKKIIEQATAVRNQITQYGHQDFSLQIDEAKDGLRYEISGVKEESQTARKEDMSIIQQLSNNLREQYEINHKLVNDFERYKDSTDKKIENLKSEVDTLKREKSEKEQEIAEKSHAHNSTENTKSLDDSNKIEFLDE